MNLEDEFFELRSAIYTWRALFGEIPPGMTTQEVKDFMNHEPELKPG